MRSYVWCQRLDRTCASTAGLCASSYTAATAGFQSIQSLYCAATELPTHHADNTKHSTFNAEYPSKSRVACE